MILWLWGTKKWQRLSSNSFCLPNTLQTHEAIKHVYPHIVPDHWSCFGVIYIAKGCVPMEKWIYLIFDRIWNLILVDALTLASVSKTGDFPHFSKYPNLWRRMLCKYYMIFFSKKFRSFFLRNSFSNRGECRVTFPVLNQFPTLEPRSSTGLYSYFLLKLISVCWCSNKLAPLNCCKGFKKVLKK